MAGKTVLVIDTDIDTEHQIMSTLESAGYLVFAAQTDDVLSENAMKVSPSLLFFSAPASGAKGLEICGMIHQNRAFSGIPIIAITPFDEPMDPRYTTLYGIVDILKIPFADEDLLRRTEAALSRTTFEVPGKKSEEAAAAFGRDEEEAPPQQKAPAPEPKPKVKVTVTPPPVVEDIPLKDVFGDIERNVQPPFPPPPAKKKSNIVILVSLILFLVILAGAAAFFYKDMIFPPSKTAGVAKAPVPKPEAPPVQPAPAQQQAAQAGTAPAGQTPQPASKPVQAPEPAAAKPAQTAEQGKTGFSAQIGAFKEAGHADALAQKYKAKGYDAFVKKSMSKDKGAIHRVLVGKYSDRKECQKMAETLRAKEKIQAVIYSD